ncbi:homoserine dehydrogenase [Bacillus methanolicus]|uniref:homoserine dehydrogenase n=1 Tax=Bacillus methanolicus TaxID=1471 RepID=UPI00238081FE|nr:homoserine dehydrogenase [Bacillus methanolicus]MDE3837872.1 homoserine dehydrogenase [Bacillus methanolicus]
MSTIHIALLGYGTVGKGVYQTIKTHQNRFKAILGKEVKIEAVLVKNLEKHKLPDQDVILTNKFEDIINLPKLDVVIDAIVGKEPGFSYLSQAIKRGCHIITANKQMFAHYGRELLSLAEKHGVSVGFEATVAGGIPVIQTLRKLLSVNHIKKVDGILNGTSNFILTKMREEGLSFSDALSLAQEKGYAEADPTNDVEGFDAFYKAMILSEVIYGKQPDWETVQKQGISSITLEQIELFSKLGLRFKHVATLEKTAKGIHCSVKPVLVSSSHPLFHVEDVQNAVSIDADIVGNISLQGPGAGMFPTASAIVEDLIQLEAERARPEEGADHEIFTHKPLLTWVLYGEVNKFEIPDSLEIIGEINSKTLLVLAKEESIENFQNQIKGITVYQLLGEFTFSNAEEIPYSTAKHSIIGS